jgi:UDP-glucose 4-epimerase
LRRGERVRVLDDLSAGRRENLEQAERTGRLELTIGSVCDSALVGRLLEGCSQAYHLAASVGVGMVTDRPAECLNNNVRGVQAVLQAASALKERPRIVLFSSSEVYGKSDQIPLREDGDLVLGPSSVPRWSYASGKVMGEFLALAEHARAGVPVTIVRCFNTCGPRQRATYGMVVPRFLDQAARGEPLTVFGDGIQSRCFSFVDDVVWGVLQLAARPEAVGQIYNIGTDRETTVLELAGRVLTLFPSPSTIRCVPYPEAYGVEFQDVRRRVPDLRKIRGLLGHLPSTDLDSLLRITGESRRNGRGLTTLAGAAAPHPAS